MSAAVTFIIFQSFQGANGGVESATQILADLTARRRVVLTQAETRFTHRWREMGCEVHVWPVVHRRVDSTFDLVVSRAERAISLARFNLRVASFMRSRGLRVAHCNDISAFWHAAPGAKAAGARVIFNVRSIFADDVPYGPKWRVIHNLADHIVCLSDEMRDVVRTRFPPQLGPPIPTATLDVIYTGLDLSRHRPPSLDERASARDALGISESEIAIGQIAKVWPIKNQLAFLENAASEILARCPAAKLHFVGDFEPSTDSYAARCLEVVRKRGLEERVRFHGFVGDPTPWYRALDLTFLVSVYEGLARALLESLANGVPMVAFDVTSMREILEGSGAGAVVRQGDWNGLVDEITRLARDPVLRMDVAGRGRSVAEASFDARRTAAAYAALYGDARCP